MYLRPRWKADGVATLPQTIGILCFSATVVTGVATKVQSTPANTSTLSTVAIFSCRLVATAGLP